MPFASVDAFSRIQAPVGATVVSVSIDVTDCYHRMFLPERMRGYLAVEIVSTGDYGIESCDGVPLEKSAQVALVCRTLPMGSSWAVYLAQTSTLRSSRLCDKLAGAIEVHDRGAVNDRGAVQFVVLCLS